MDVEKCRALLKILEEGSLSAAAERMGYTPSGLSRMVASMEEDAGFPLLFRGRHGVSATGECERLIPIYQEFVRLEELYRQSCADILGLDTGAVIVGTAYSVYYKWLSKVIAAFSAHYPGIEVRIKEGKSSELYKMLQEHKLDFCISSRREGRASWYPLFHDPLVAVVSAESRWAKEVRFPVSAFEAEPYIETFPGQDTDNSRMFVRSGTDPNVQFATEDTYASHRMVEAGLGVSLSNYIEAVERVQDKSVKLLELDPPQLVEIGIASPDEEHISPAARKFRDFAMEFLDELPRGKGWPEPVTAPLY